MEQRRIVDAFVMRGDVQKSLNQKLATYIKQGYQPQGGVALDPTGWDKVLMVKCEDNNVISVT